MENGSLKKPIWKKAHQEKSPSAEIVDWKKAHQCFKFMFICVPIKRWSKSVFPILNVLNEIVMVLVVMFNHVCHTHVKQENTLRVLECRPSLERRAPILHC